MAGALTQSAEAIFNRLSLREQALARGIFLRMTEVVDVEEDGLPTYFARRRAPLAELVARPEDTGPVRDILSRLANARLVIIGQESAELAHEALIYAWPRLLGWLNENQAAIRLHHRLAATAREWQRSAQDEGFLYRGGRLAQARDWAATHLEDLNELERQFLDAAVNHEETQQRQKLAAAQRLAEIEQQRAADQTRAAAGLRRRSALLAGTLVMTILLAVAAVGFAHISRRNASQALASEIVAQARADEASRLKARALANAEVANSRMLALASANMVDSDPELSLLLALQARETAGTQEANESLHLALQSSRLRRAFETGGTGGNLVLMDLSPDGARLATVAEDEVMLWSTSTGELLQRLPLEEPDAAPYEFDIDASGRRLALLAADENAGQVSLQTWDLAAGGRSTARTFPVELDQMSALALSPDWQTVAIGGEDGRTRLLDIASGRERADLGGHSTRVIDVEFSPDGRRLATADPGGMVLVWDEPASLAAGTDDQPVTLDTRARLGRTGNLAKIAFIDEATMVLGYLGEVEVWDLADTTVPRFGLAGETKLTKNYAVSPDHTRLATTAQDGITRIWDLSNGEYLLSLARHYAPVDDAAFSPNGEEMMTIDRNGQVKVWDSQSGFLGELNDFPVNPGTFDVELSPDGRQLALGSVAGPAGIWDAAGGQHLFTLSGDGPVYRVAYNPDGTRLATVGQDNQIRIWDTATGAEVMSFSGHGAGAAGGLFAGTLDVAFSPDGERLATAGADGRAIIWEAATGRLLHTLTGHTGAIQSLAYSPDGRLIATSTDQDDTTLKVWDADTGAEIYTLAGHPVHVWGLAFSPDSATLVSGGTRGVIKAWDMTTGEEIYTVNDQSDEVGSIVFTPDGEYFLTTGAVPLRVRRLRDGREVMTLAGPTIWSLDISPDGRWIYAADVDGMVRILALDPGDAETLAYERLSRWWRTDECRRYLGSEECPPVPARLDLND